ncbi:MAG: SprT family zinc-dependent metalloprotease [Bacteroidota bacterium]
MSHYIDYGSVRIEFELRYAERRTLDIAVQPDRQVLVIAPLDSSVDRIYAKVRKRASWILKQQRFFLTFEPRRPSRKYISGETHLYLGRQYRLKVYRTEAEFVKLKGKYFEVSISDRLDFYGQRQVEALLNNWYHQRAMIKFPELAKPYLRRFERLGARPTEIHLRKMDKRWGSCTPSGKLILNTELIQAPRGCIEYVIVHELCHLLHPNHGAAFRALQEEEFPLWEKWKRVLEEKLA